MASKKQVDDRTRLQICRKYDNGKNNSLIAIELELNRKTVASITRIYKSSGRIYAKKHDNQKSKRLHQK